MVAASPRRTGTGGRALRVLALPGTLMLGAFVLGACGQAGEPGGVTVTASSTAVTDLTIRVDDGAGTVTTTRLQCEPTGGDHPDPAAACATLEGASARAAFAPVPADTMCTMIFGGPQKATISGTLRGEAVNASFDRGDGCQIARWEALPAVLG